MTTVAQVKVAVRPLLARNSDLALVSRFLILKPVGHLVRGVLIDRRSAKEVFHVRYAVLPLFQPQEHFFVSYGADIYGKGIRWTSCDSASQIDMCETIEREALPLLRGVRTVDDFIAYTKTDTWHQIEKRLFQFAFIQAARGEFKAVREICAEPEKISWNARDWPDNYDRLMNELLPLVETEDRAGVARLLREYESISARALKLDKLWEPSPFSFERADGE